MFGFKKKDHFGPKKLDGVLSRWVAEEWQRMPTDSDHWMTFLMVEKTRGEDPDEVDIRIFDKWIVDQKKIKILNYDSLDAYPEVVLFEGRYNKRSKKADLKSLKAA